MNKIETGTLANFLTLQAFFGLSGRETDVGPLVFLVFIGLDLNRQAQESRHSFSFAGGYKPGESRNIQELAYQ